MRGEFCYHGDTLDMEAFRQRAAFVKQAAHELAAKEETIHREVGQLWTVLAELAAGADQEGAGGPPEEARDDGRGAGGRDGAAARSAPVGASA